MKLRTATRLFIVGITVLVILVALAVQLSRGSGHQNPTCRGASTPCVSTLHP